MFETFVISEILKSFANEGLDYRHFVSYYRGRDRKKVTESHEIQETEIEIDMIIEENGILYPIEIKKKHTGKGNDDICICGCTAGKSTPDTCLVYLMIPYYPASKQAGSRNILP